VRERRPVDPREARSIRIEAAVLVAAMVFVAGAWALGAL
jgi:hypothetical protein